MSPAKKTDSASANSDQQSAVRSRRASHPELPIPRDVRIEQKLARARALLAELPPGDARSHLLHVAVLRRDEALLDGILASLK